jgi:hypothetical protein
VKHNRFFRILTIAIILSLLMIVVPATPVLAQSISLSPEVGKIGDKVNIGGTGFLYGLGLFIYFSSQQADVGDEIDIDVTAYENVKRVVTGDVKDPKPGGFDISINSFKHGVPAELTGGDDHEMVHGGTYYVYAAEEHSGVILTVDKFTVIGIANMTPAEAPVGTRVTIEGVAFEDKEFISMQYDGVDVPIANGATKTDDNGDFTCKIDIPPSTVGLHTITAIVGDVGADAQFTVVPTITLSPAVGGANDQLTVTGTGFGAKVAFTITFDGEPMVISGDEETDDYGSFVSTFVVPSEVEPGTYDIRVADDDGNTAEAEFGITTNLTLSAGATAESPGYVGMPLTINGTGFKANWPITITYASEPVTFTTTSEADGSFSYPITVPTSAAGVHIITATDETNTTQTRFFMESTPPQTPSILLPLADSQLEDWKFDWEDVTDESQPVTYDFQVATDADFTALSVDKTEITASAYILTGDDKLEKTSEDEPYYWRVRAVDSASNVGDWTTASAFYVGSSFTGIHGWLLYTLIGVGALLAIILGIWIGRKLTTREEDYWG